MDNYGWIEIVFVAGVALGLGFWQLWSVNREIAKDRAAKNTANSGATGHLVGEHPLDER